MSEFARFFTVTVLGLIIDLAIAYALNAGLGVPLWLAAAAGFTLAAGVNYVIHQTWSFQSGPRGFSVRRAALYGGTALVTLAVRVAIVAVDLRGRGIVLRQLRLEQVRGLRRTARW